LKLPTELLHAANVPVKPIEPTEPIKQIVPVEPVVPVEPNVPVLPPKFGNTASVDVKLSKRQVRAPGRLKDFVRERKMFTCTLPSVTDESQPCGATYAAESGIRRHMVIVHHTRFSRQGNHSRLGGDELEKATKQVPLAQINSTMRKRPRTSDAGGSSRVGLLCSHDVQVAPTSTVPQAAESTADPFVLDDDQWQEVLAAVMPQYETTGVGDSRVTTAEKATEKHVETNDKNVGCDVDVKNTAIQTEACESNRVRGYQAPLNFSNPVTLAAVVQAGRRQSDESPDQLARRLACSTVFGRSLSGREHELAEFALRVTALCERHFARDLEEIMCMIRNSVDPQKTAGVLYSQYINKLRQRPRRPDSPTDGDDGWRPPF